jgi:hypothetical protein
MVTREGREYRSSGYNSVFSVRPTVRLQQPRDILLPWFKL